MRTTPGGSPRWPRAGRTCTARRRTPPRSCRHRRGCWTPAAAPAGSRPGWPSSATTCTGVDVDPSMLAVARREHPGLAWVLADLGALRGGRRGGGRRVRPGARRRQRHSAAGRRHPAVDGGRARPGAGSIRAAGLRLRAGRRPPAPRVPGDPAVGVRPRPATRPGWGWSGGWRPGTVRRTTGAATRSAFTPLQALCIRPSLDSLGVPPLATVGPASTGTKGDHHR